MPTIPQDAVATAPNIKGTSAIYTQKNKFRSYLFWYMVAALPIFAMWGAMLGIILPNHVQMVEFARFSPVLTHTLTSLNCRR
ncbi:hypothetical protein [Microbacterium panaciterrae]|uniref:Uncharacterized protein n=1 Tax=Microbacterium panaciterrae TaxID=985759 RepID=A0ABP8PQB7_9MICO